MQKMAISSPSRLPAKCLPLSISPILSCQVVGFAASLSPRPYPWFCLSRPQYGDDERQRRNHQQSHAPRSLEVAVGPAIITALRRLTSAISPSTMPNTREAEDIRISSESAHHAKPEAYHDIPQPRVHGVTADHSEREYQRKQYSLPYPSDVDPQPTAGKPQDEHYHIADE